MQIYKKIDLNASSFIKEQQESVGYNGYTYTFPQEFFKNIWGFLNSMYSLATININLKLQFLENITMKYNKTNIIDFLNDNQYEQLTDDSNTITFDISYNDMPLFNLCL